MSHLVKFELFVNLDVIQNHHVKHIMHQILRNLPHLEVLSLCFELCPKVDKGCFKTFGYHTKRYLPKLKHLNLSFGDEINPDPKLKFDVLFPNLRSLYLNLNHHPNINDQELTYFASNSLSKLQVLGDLTLKLHSCFNIADKGIQGLCFSIGKITTLKRLEIDFFECKGISDEGLKSVGQEVCHKNINLTDLTVSFDCCDLITDSGIISFANELGGAQMKGLEKLHIDFSRAYIDESNITDISLQAISKALSQNLKSLLYLDLYFNRCDQITDKGLEYLVKQIEKNEKNEKTLKKVRLNFEICSSITEDYVEKTNKRLGDHRYNVVFHLEWSPFLENRFLLD